MEKQKKQVKEISWYLIICGVLSIIRFIVETFLSKIDPETLPEGMTVELARISLILGCVVFVALKIPSFYVAAKGFSVANDTIEKEAKAHLTWAKILFVLSIVSVVITISGLGSSNNLVVTIAGLVISLLDVGMLFLYVKNVTEIKKAAE